MSMNNAETYRKMLNYLTARGFDVGSHSNARVASMSYTSLEELDRVDLQHYEVILEATLENSNEYMDKMAMVAELDEIKQRLGHSESDEETEDDDDAPRSEHASFCKRNHPLDGINGVSCAQANDPEE